MTENLSLQHTTSPHTWQEDLGSRNKSFQFTVLLLILQEFRGNYKKEEDTRYLLGVALERNKVRLGGKNVLLPPATLRKHSLTESSLKNWRVTGVVQSSLQHPTAALIARVSTAAFSVAGVNQLNMQGWSALGFSAQGAKLSVCNTGTK